MAKDIFYFKRFVIRQDKCAMKVGMDAMLLGAHVPVSNGMKVLDIGTGSGVLALMLAQKAKIKIDAIDSDFNAINQTMENVALSSFSARIVVHHVPLQSFATPYQYDLILSNPPYFTADGKAAQYSDALRHAARNTASLHPVELPGLVASLLNPQGQFFVILPLEYKRDLIKYALEVGLHLNQELLIKSFENKEPKRIIMGFSFAEKPIISNSIIIYKEKGFYSSDYKNLTADFHAVSLK